MTLVANGGPQKTAVPPQPLVQLQTAVSQQIIGQAALITRVLVALLADGHVLLEGVPGLAKTLLVKTVGQAIRAQFTRVQFTPDLLPADLIGTQIYNPHSHSFTTHKGPIFANLILADEINRAPAKVQSALLEAMQERQVTIGGNTYPLAAPFLVLATQNPIEQDGTYPLPEAQVDRFLFKLLVDYPARDDERCIIVQQANDGAPPIRPVLSPDELLQLRQEVQQAHVDPRLVDYVLDVVRATRPAESTLPQLTPYIATGASPRAGIFLVQAAKAYAFLHGRPYVIPDDIKALAPDILRHRLITTFEAEAEGVTPDQLVQQLLDSISVP
jgi:MoxR-like ATPase